MKEQNNYLMELQNLVVDCLKDEKVKIVLFGSRARKKSVVTSDVDIGILPYEKLDETKIAFLREKIENSNIPYKVDVVNFSEVSDDFKKEALKEMVVWKDSR